MGDATTAIRDQSSGVDAQRRVERYFTQLTKGCGRPTGCYTAHCSNCKAGRGPMDPNSAAVLALQLAQRGTDAFCSTEPYLDMDLVRHTEGLHADADARAAAVAEVARNAFRSVRALDLSFRRAPRAPSPAIDGVAAIPGADDDAAADGAGASDGGAQLGLDFGRVAEFWTYAAAAPGELAEACLNALVDGLAAGASLAACPRACATVLACPALVEPQFHASVLEPVYAAIAALDDAQQAALEAAWRGRPAAARQHMVRCCHEYTIICVLENSPLPYPLNPEIRAAVQVLGVLHEANAGAAEPLPFHAFYNDAINQELAANDEYLREDFRRWQVRDGFSLCDYAFTLDASSKQLVLKLDAYSQMEQEFQSAMLRSIFTMSMQSPFLVLRVRRDHLIRDTLHQLASRTSDLKRPLKVHIVGEEGVDEGGVQKEFFQLITRELFDPDYGMWLQDERSGTFWFNQASLESAREFEMIGLLLGIAIYNGVILDVRFPHVVYKKLVGSPCDFADFEEAFPDVARGLRQLLEHTGDVSELALTFSVTYEMYGERKVAELHPGGAEKAVTRANRDDYVRRYVDHALNESVAKQFNNFALGFHRVCGGAALELFRWQELELLVCGSPDFDFEALERGAVYEDGYTRDSETIKLFWQVVHGLEAHLKRKVLIFTTGSDRVPIRGLSNLRFVISRNGSDEARLPSAHTCFNHLLLPEYKTAETLEARLLTAINDTEGFHIV